MIIFDNDGNIFAMHGGSYTVPNGGVQYLEVEYNADEMVTGIDMSDPSNPVAVIEKQPKMISIEDLKEQIQMLEEAIMEMSAEVYKE